MQGHTHTCTHPCVHMHTFISPTLASCPEQLSRGLCTLLNTPGAWGCSPTSVSSSPSAFFTLWFFSENMWPHLAARSPTQCLGRTRGTWVSRTANLPRRPHGGRAGQQCKLLAALSWGLGVFQKRPCYVYHGPRSLSEGQAPEDCADAAWGPAGAACRRAHEPPGC